MSGDCERLRTTENGDMSVFRSHDFWAIKNAALFAEQVREKNGLP